MVDAGTAARATARSGAYLDPKCFLGYVSTVLGFLVHILLGSRYSFQEHPSTYRMIAGLKPPMVFLICGLMQCVPFVASGFPVEVVVIRACSRRTFRSLGIQLPGGDQPPKSKDAHQDFRRFPIGGLSKAHPQSRVLTAPISAKFL